MSGGWIVDAHTHIFPPRLATKIRAFFERHIVEAPDSEGNHDPIPCCPPPEVFEKEYHTLNDLKPHRAAPIPMHSHDLEQIVPPMRDAHIGGNWILPYAHKADMADQLNTDIVKISQKLQEHYGMNTVPGFTVHPSDGPEAVGRITRQAILRGARVAKLHCSVGAYSVLHPNFAPFWSLSEQILWPTVVHAGGHASGQTLIKELEQIDKLAERYPKARIIIAHSGAPACKQGIELAMKRPNVYLDTTTGVVSLPPLPTPAQQPHYDYMIKLAREGRILFGSDIPNVAMQLPDVVRGNTQVFDVDGKFAGGRVPQSLEEAGKEGDPLYELFYGAATRLVREVKPEAATAAQASL